MSYYVYEEVARTKKVLAKNTTERNRGIRYYCPNYECDARMFLWNLDGESKSFFRSSGRPGHAEGCPYGSDNTYSPEKTKEEGFEADEAISNLMVAVTSKDGKKVNPKPPKEEESKEAVVPHTIKQIYDMCKVHYCKETFNGQIIGQILLDTRSSYMYPKGVFGYRIIEAKCMSRLYDNTNIYLETPIDNVRYHLKLHFIDVNLYKEVRNLLYNNTNHVIAIAGKWESSGEYNCFVTEFNSKRQIKVLKRTI